MKIFKNFDYAKLFVLFKILSTRFLNHIKFADIKLSLYLVLLIMPISVLSQNTGSVDLNNEISYLEVSFAAQTAGCTNTFACNYNANATVDDNSCNFIGDACNDFNFLTSNDMLDANCNCVGDNTIIATGQLNIQAVSNSQLLAENFLGSNVEISNLEINCPTGASGIFEGSNTNIGLTNGILLTSGAATNSVGPNDSGSISQNNGAPGDSDLNALIAQPTNDACVLEFDFIAEENELTFNYVFGSEEYLEFVDQFNDVFAFFVSGPGINGTQNIATIPGSNQPVTINSINNEDNNTLFVNNGDGVTNIDLNSTIQYDGFTTVLSTSIALIPCEVYHIKIAIADAGDSALDSGVFLESGSFSAEDDGCPITTLNALEQNYLQSIGTPFEDYAFQYFCIADKTCEEFNTNGTDGWANGFVTYVWEFFESRNDGPIFYDLPCVSIPNIPNFVNEYLCFSQEGFFDHYITEMAPAFFSYCANCNSDNQADWDNFHTNFLDDAVVPCFNDVIDMPDLLACVTAETTVFFANGLREVAQAYCDNSGVIGNTSSILQSFNNDFLVGNATCVGQAAEQVIEDGANFVVETGEIVVDNVIVGGEVIIDAGGNFVDWLNPLNNAAFALQVPQNPVYFIDLNPAYYTIQNGVLTITGSPSPFSNFSPIVNVFSFYNDSLSIIQQFMITDLDTDGDLIGDNFEINIGLDPLVQNTTNTDLDNDGLNDYFEVVIGSNPLNSDTDFDGFPDSLEVNEITDYNDPNNFPGSFNCNDGILNGDETSIDCGGSCPNACTLSDFCNDGIMNGDEEGIDCGGSCQNNCLTLSAVEIDACNCSNTIAINSNTLIEHQISLQNGTAPFTVLNVNGDILDLNGNSLSVTQLSNLFNNNTIVSVYTNLNLVTQITIVDVLGDVSSLDLVTCTICLTNTIIDSTCNTTTLNFADLTASYNANTLQENISYPNLDFDISINDPNNIFVDAVEYYEGLQIGIDPNNVADEISISYSFSETVNFVQFKVKDLDFKNSVGGSNQQESISIYGLLNGNAQQIVPIIDSFDGSVLIVGNNAQATTNSINGNEESVLATFNQCVDEVVIVYGTGDNSPVANPTFSKIQIGTEFGFIAENCFPNDCSLSCEGSGRLDFTKNGVDWNVNSIAENYTVGSQTFDIEIDDPFNVFVNSFESNRGIAVRIDPLNLNQSIAANYSFGNVSNYTAFDIEDIEYKIADMQQEQVTVVGTLAGTTVLPTITSLSGSVEINGNVATGTINSSVDFEESVLVIFDEPIDGFSVIQSTASNTNIVNPGTSKIFIGKSLGIYTGDCNNTIIAGCTDVNACNYNATANLDDNSCILTGDVCDDLNSATINDALNVNCVCEGEIVVLGCTDVNACNYNATANTNDNSCMVEGDFCDDLNSATINDVIDASCNCVGSVLIQPNCPSTLFLNNIVLSDPLYHAEIMIFSNSEVLNNSSTNLKAGSFIELNTGFEVDTNCNLNVEIETCE